MFNGKVLSSIWFSQFGNQQVIAVITKSILWWSIFDAFLNEQIVKLEAHIYKICSFQTWIFFFSFIAFVKVWSIAIFWSGRTSIEIQICQADNMTILETEKQSEFLSYLAVSPIHLLILNLLLFFRFWYLSRFEKINWIIVSNIAQQKICLFHSIPNFSFWLNKSSVFWKLVASTFIFRPDPVMNNVFISGPSVRTFVCISTWLFVWLSVWLSVCTAWWAISVSQRKVCVALSSCLVFPTNFSWRLALISLKTCSKIVYQLKMPIYLKIE